MSTPTIIGLKGRTIHTPKGGWKKQTYYVAEVAFSRHNVVHRALFYSGFLNGKGGLPGGYSGFLTTDGQPGLDAAYYFKPIQAVMDDNLDLIDADQRLPGYDDLNPSVPQAAINGALANHAEDRVDTVIGECAYENTASDETPVEGIGRQLRDVHDAMCPRQREGFNAALVALSGLTYNSIVEYAIETLEAE